jgi:hypothetical protein
MDREDCPFHCDMVEDQDLGCELPVEPGPVVRAPIGDANQDQVVEAGMKIRYDPEVDALRILLSESPVEENDEDKPGVILDSPSVESTAR